MSPAVRSRIDRKQTENAEAYQFYLKGRFAWNKRTVPDLLKSIEFFCRAIEQDSTYALAYAGLASSHVVLPAFGRSPQEHYRRAHQAATRALELDSTLAEARTVLAQIFENRYEWVNAEEEYSRAIEFNPGYPTAHQWYSGLLVTIGRFDDAIREARRAVELDPLSLIINYNLARSLLYVRQYDQAIHQCNKGIELDPAFPWSYYNLGTVAEVQGRFDEAIRNYQKARLLSPDDPTLLGELGRVYARAGLRNEASQALHALSEYGKQGYLLNFYMANVYYGLGDRDKTFEWLERSIRDHDASVMDMNSNPLWDDLRSDPRFVALLKKVGLRK